MESVRVVSVSVEGVHVASITQLGANVNITFHAEVTNAVAVAVSNELRKLCSLM